MKANAPAWRRGDVTRQHFSNLAEFAAGGVPTQPDDVFTLELKPELEWIGGVPHPALTWTTRANLPLTCEVEAWSRDSAGNGAWSPESGTIGTTAIADGRWEWKFVGTAPVGSAPWLWRLRLTHIPPL